MTTLLRPVLVPVRPVLRPAKRPCLKCHELFDSVGFHNRICPTCDRVNTRVSKPAMFRTLTEDHDSPG